MKKCFWFHSSTEAEVQQYSVGPRALEFEQEFVFYMLLTYYLQRNIFFRLQQMNHNCDRNKKRKAKKLVRYEEYILERESMKLIV